MLLLHDKFSAELAVKILGYKAEHYYLEDRGLFWDRLKRWKLQNGAHELLYTIFEKTAKFAGTQNRNYKIK